MRWKPKQIRAGVIAARHADWNDQQRQMVLSSLGGRAVHQGRITSKSPRLNQDDYEQYMATAEAEAGGTLPGFTTGYWRAKADDVIQKQRHKIIRLASELDIPDEKLGGMIHRATGGKASSIEDLDQLNDRAVASKVIDLLKDKRPRAEQPMEAVPF